MCKVSCFCVGWGAQCSVFRIQQSSSLLARMGESAAGGHQDLLLGNLSVDMLKFEHTKIRQGRGSSVVRQGNPIPIYAAVSLSDIRIPLQV